MRKIYVTILLSILTLLSVTAAVILAVDGSLARVTGWYHFRPGMKLFPDSSIKRLKEVHWMRIQDLHDTIECRRGQDGTWWIVSPFRDRMSPLAVQNIFSFTEHATLVDTLPLNRTTRASLREFGVETNPHTITMKVPSGDDEDDMSTVARYTLGSASPWLADAQDGEHVLPTSYLRTNFYGRDKRIHVVSGNVLSIFKNGLQGLRDPHVFHFEPNELLGLKIQKQGSPTLISLSRQSAELPWIVVSPIISEADQDNVETLVSQFSRLKAIRIDTADAVELPPAPEICIDLALDGREPVQLKIYPTFTSPADGQPLCYATVSDRPVVFTLPVEPRMRRKGSYAELVSNILSLPILPPSVQARLHAANDTLYLTDLSFDLKTLRSSSLSNIDNKDVDKAYLRSRFSPYPVKLVRIPGDSEGQVQDIWMVSAEGKRFQEADTEVVNEFLNSFSAVPVADFVRDFEPGENVRQGMQEYGLLSPDYIVMLQPRECAARAVLFGVDLPLVKDRSPRTFYMKRTRMQGKSAWLAMEQNMNSIYRLSPKMTKLFAFTSEAWKKRNMVQFPISALRTLRLHYQQAILELHFDYMGNEWTGTLAGEDVTPRINPHRTTYFVRHLQRIRVDQWLGQDDASALEALRNPVFTVSLELEETDYSDTERLIVDQKEDDALRVGASGDVEAVEQLLTENSETDVMFRNIALGQRKVEKRTITLDVAPSSLRLQRPYFYGRIRETGELFILSYDNAQGLDGKLLD